MKEHIEYLQNLGLTEYQARALIVLFAKREENAEGICRHTGIPLSKIYGVLKSLEDKGAIKCTPGRPRLFRCDKPTEVLNELIRRIATRVETLKDAKNGQLKKIKIMWLPEIHREKAHPILETQIAA